MASYKLVSLGFLLLVVVIGPKTIVLLSGNNLSIQYIVYNSSLIYLLVLFCGFIFGTRITMLLSSDNLSI